MTETGGKKAENPGYLTTQEVADRLRVTRRTVYSWITNRLLDADKAGPKIWVVSEQHLADFLERSRPLPRRVVTVQSADPSKWGTGRQRAAAPPAAPASAVRPVPPQKSPERQGPRLGSFLEEFQAAFGPGEDVELFEDGSGAYGYFEAAAPRPSIPPAKISSKKRVARRR